MNKYGEECDDKNILDSDGCNSNCKIEEGYRCNYDEKEQKSICKKSDYNSILIKSKLD